MNKTKEKVNAAIVIIGNEILSGRTQDVNVLSISNWLNDLGIKLNEVRVITDIEKIIVDSDIIDNGYMTSIIEIIIKKIN